MQEAPVASKVLSVLSSILGVPRESVSIGSSRDTVAEWDSLKHMNFMLALEDEFRVEFTDQEVGALTSVSSLCDAITSKTSAGGVKQ
jgi:acyl carrier protein